MKHVSSFFSICITILFLCLFVQPVYSTVPSKKNLSPYFGAKIGYSHYLEGKIIDNDPLTEKIRYNDSANMAIGIVGGISYSIIPSVGIRAELEYTYRTPSELKMKNFNGYYTINNHAILANMYVDYYINRKLGVYAGFGLGASIIDIELTTNGQFAFPQKTNFAFQIGGGVRYAITKNIIIDCNLRYLDLGKWEHKQQINYISSPFSAMEVLLSVTYAL